MPVTSSPDLVLSSQELQSKTFVTTPDLWENKRWEIKDAFLHFISLHLPFDALLVHEERLADIWC